MSLKRNLATYPIMMDKQFFFVAQNGRECDLPQPENGEPRCLIGAKGGLPPRPYRGPDDIRAVIYDTMRVNNKGLLPDTVDDLVAYYQETTQDYVGRLAELKVQLNAIAQRDRTGWGAMLDAA